MSGRESYIPLGGPGKSTLPPLRSPSLSGAGRDNLRLIPSWLKSHLQNGRPLALFGGGPSESLEHQDLEALMEGCCEELERRRKAYEVEGRWCFSTSGVPGFGLGLTRDLTAASVNETEAAFSA